MKEMCEKKIAKINKYEDFYNSRKYLSEEGQGRWFDRCLVPLASDLATKTGLEAKISGPFGLRSECYIDLFGYNIRKSICIIPDVVDGNIQLYYETGNVKDNSYPEGSIGYINRYNHEIKRLPDSIEEIVKLLRNCRCKKMNEKENEKCN